MSRERWITTISFAFGLLIVIILYSGVISNREHTIFNFVTILGTYVSIFGLFVAYLQISSVKKIAKETEIKVRETTERITLVLSISDISKAVKVAEEAQSLLNSNNYHAALLRLKDLKTVLIQTSMINSLKIFSSTPDYIDVKTRLFDDINNLSDFANGRKNKINFSVINSDLEKISSILIEFENRLKSSQ